jgi:hypothetical protein
VSDRREAYTRKVLDDLAQLRQEVMGSEIDDALLEADEPWIAANPICEGQIQDVATFTSLCGFAPAEFNQLKDQLEPVLARPQRGRVRVIGAIDSLFLFLHWLRTGSSINMIAAGFNLRQETLHKRMLEVVKLIETPLTARYLDEMAKAPFHGDDDFGGCGLVVDATVQNRGRPAGQFADVVKYFSGKHRLYCLKSQVVVNRSGFAVLVHAGLLGSQHDLAVFRQTLPDVERLVRAHPGEPCHILADKGYIGEIASQWVHLVTPVRQPQNGYLGQEEIRHNRVLSRQRVIVENFLGRLSAKFHIMVRRWAFSEQLYPSVFRICCALVNFDMLRPRGALRAGDGTFYRKALTRAIAKALVRERHPQQANYRPTAAEIAAEEQRAREIQEGEVEKDGPLHAPSGGPPDVEPFE